MQDLLLAAQAHPSSAILHLYLQHLVEHQEQVEGPRLFVLGGREVMEMAGG